MIIYNDFYISRDEVLKEIKNLDPSNATQEIDISYKCQERKCWIIGMNFLHCSFNEYIKSWDFERKSTLKSSSGAFEKYEYIHLGTWYIKLTLYNRFFFSIKKRYSSFLIKVFVFQKFFFKVTSLKTFKFSIDCRRKTCQSLAENRFLKESFFRRIYALYVGFKMKSLTKSVFLC